MKGRKELVDYRSKYVKKLFVLLHFAESGNEDAINLLEEACDSSAEYSAFAVVHIRPHLQKIKQLGD
jgi:hypothetical protein